MENAEISRLINSFNAIKGYFDTTKRYMPQIAKLVFFIEEIVPLLETIHASLHQSSSLIPDAAAKLNKVTSATELAATEVMDIVDNVINRLNNMTASLDEIEEKSGDSKDTGFLNEKTALIREEINGSQDDLFLIMNALQFQDITTQQINSIASTIDNVNKKLGDLLKGFETDGIEYKEKKEAAFDPNAEFDFERSAESQRVADEYLEKGINGIEVDERVDSQSDSSVSPKSDEGKTEQAPESVSESEIEGEIAFGEDGQPDINSIMNRIKAENN